MWFLLFLGVCTCTEKSLLEQEREEIRHLISLLDEKQAHLESLKASTEGIPVGTSWKNIPGIVESSSDLYFNFTHNSPISLSGNILCIEFVSLRTSPSSMLLSVISDTHIYMLTPEGEILYSHQAESSGCSILSTPEEIHVLLYRNNQFQFGSVPTSAPFSLNISAPVSLFNSSAQSLSVLTSYARMGKKYWIIGDNSGHLLMFNLNGEFLSQGFTGGNLTSIDRMGQQLIFTSPEHIGIYNLGSMEVHQRCERSVSEILRGFVDPNNNQMVYTVTKSGDIISYNTRFSVNNSPVTCKAIRRVKNRFSSEFTKLALTSSHLFTWDGSLFGVFSENCFDMDNCPQSSFYMIQGHNSDEFSLIRSHRHTGNAQFIALSSHNTLYVAEVIVIRHKPVQQNAPSFDSGYMRMIAIVGGIIIIVIYRVKTRKSKAEMDVEKLEKSLEDLQSSVKKTAKMNQGLQTRFQNAERETRDVMDMTKNRFRDN